MEQIPVNHAILLVKNVQDQLLLNVQPVMKDNIYSTIFVETGAKMDIGDKKVLENVLLATPTVKLVLDPVR